MLQPTSRLIPLFVQSAFATLLISPPSHSVELEETVVKATRLERKLQDLPLAVSVFSSADLKNSAVQDIYQLQTLAPSLQVVQGTSANSASFGIRGVSTGSVNAGLEPSVGLYVDGVYRARQGSMISNLFDINRIEILRGPQGTLFGRNTVAGALTVLTVEPDHAGSGFLELGTGADKLRQATGAVSISAIDQVLALRASGFTMQRDGSVSDQNLGNRVLNNRDRWGARLQALYTPSQDIKVRLIADAAALDEKCCAIGSWKNNLVATNLPPGSAIKTGTDLKVLELGGTVVPDGDFYDYRTSLDTMPESSNDDHGLSAQLDWQFNHFLLTSVTAYRSYDFHDSGDADFTDIDALGGRYTLDQTQVSQELQFSHEYDRFRYITGLYWFKNDVDSVGDIIVGDDLAALVGLFGNAFPGGSRARNDGSQDNESLAVFGQTDINLSESLLVTAGLRWTQEKKRLRSQFTEDASALPDFTSPGWGFWLLPSLAPRPDVNETIEDNQTTGTLKLSWFANGTTMLYLSYGTGYKAGGINTSRIAPDLSVTFGPETSEAVELGMKVDFPAQALRVNLAAHFTRTEDLQMESFQGTGFALQNTAAAESYGGELDLSWHPLASLQLSLAYAYNHGEIKDFENGGCWIATPWHTGQPDPGDNGDGSCDRSGSLLPGNPEHKAVASGSWQFNLSRALSGSLSGEYAYSDTRMTDLNNDPIKTDGSYGLLNIRAQLTYQPWGLSIEAWSRNITDTHYTQWVQDAPVQPGRMISSYSEPRSWGLSLRKDL